MSGVSTEINHLKWDSYSQHKQFRQSCIEKVITTKLCSNKVQGTVQLFTDGLAPRQLSQQNCITLPCTPGFGPTWLKKVIPAKRDIHCTASGPVNYPVYLDKAFTTNWVNYIGIPVNGRSGIDEPQDLVTLRSSEQSNWWKGHAERKS